MMKYRKTGKFKLGFLTLLLGVLFVACGSGASDADRQIKSKTDLKGAVIGVQLGTTSDGAGKGRWRYQGRTVQQGSRCHPGTPAG